MLRTAVAIAALAGVLAGTPAHAQSPGAYLGISGGAVYTDAARNVATFAAGVHDDSVPNGFKVYGGTVWDNGFGIEFSYYNLGEYEIDNFAGAVQDELQTTAIAVSGTYTQAFSEAYYLTAKVGLAFTEAKYDCRLNCGLPFVDTTRRGNAGLIGFGLAMRAFRDVWARIEFEHVGNVRHAISTFRFNDGYDMFSVGVQVQF